MEFQILIVLIIVGFIFFPDSALGQLTQQQLEVVKLEREIELLNQQIKNSNILYTQIITPIVVGIGIAGATTFFAWQRERRIPPTVEQERIIQDIIKEWYDRNYLYAYHKIWKKIEESNNDENLIDQYWDKLSNKKFPKEYFLDESEKKLFNEEDLYNQIEFFRKKLHLSKRHTKELTPRIEAIQNSADVEYYSGVRLTLPTIVDIAVKATIDSKDKLTTNDFVKKHYESLIESSLKKLKTLMVFYRIRENKQVCDILIRAKLNEKILNLGSTPTTSSASEI